MKEEEAPELEVVEEREGEGGSGGGEGSGVDSSIQNDAVVNSELDS